MNHTFIKIYKESTSIFSDNSIVCMTKYELNYRQLHTQYGFISSIFISGFPFLYVKYLTIFCIVWHGHTFILKTFTHTHTHHISQFSKFYGDSIIKKFFCYSLIQKYWMLFSVFNEIVAFVKWWHSAIWYGFNE